MAKEEVVTTIEFGLKERILQFYFLNKRKVYGYIACILGFSALVISYFTAGPGAEDAIRAKKVFEQWKKAPLDQTLKEEMYKSLKKIEGLEQAKQSEIAQTLIAAGQIESADPLARQSIERLRKEAPLHAAYAEATLRIEKGEFQKALEASVALKAQMERELDAKALKGRSLRGGCTLYASNLLRIAFLQKQVGNAPGELSAWEEVKGLLDMHEDSVAAQLLEANFGKTGFALSDFISQRERSLVH
jgi:hypothetical protein